MNTGFRVSHQIIEPWYVGVYNRVELHYIHVYSSRYINMYVHLSYAL